MAYDPQGFLKHPRVDTPKRPAAERVRDWQPIYLRAKSRGRERAGGPVHGLRCRVLPQRLPARQPHPRVERVRRARRLGHGERAVARDQQLPRVHRLDLPGPVRGGLRARAEHRPGDDQADRGVDRRARLRRRAGRNRSRPRSGPARRWRSIGSGPAGLAAAQQLTRAGHAVTVFERDDRLGGLLRYGIPDFKMPKDLIDRRIEQMVAEGTAFRVNTDIGAADVEAAARRFRCRDPRRRRAGPARADHAGPPAARRAPGDGVPAAGQPGAGGRHRRRRASTPGAST